MTTQQGQGLRAAEEFPPPKLPPTPLCSAAPDSLPLGLHSRLSRGFIPRTPPCATTRQHRLTSLSTGLWGLWMKGASWDDEADAPLLPSTVHTWVGECHSPLSEMSVPHLRCWVVARHNSPQAGNDLTSQGPQNRRLNHLLPWQIALTASFRSILPTASSPWPLR